MKTQAPAHSSAKCVLLPNTHIAAMNQSSAEPRMREQTLCTTQVSLWVDAKANHQLCHSVPSCQFVFTQTLRKVKKLVEVQSICHLPRLCLYLVLLRGEGFKKGSKGMYLWGNYIYIYYILYTHTQIHFCCISTITGYPFTDDRTQQKT